MACECTVNDYCGRQAPCTNNAIVGNAENKCTICVNASHQVCFMCKKHKIISKTFQSRGDGGTKHLCGECFTSFAQAVGCVTSCPHCNTQIVSNERVILSPRFGFFPGVIGYDKYLKYKKKYLELKKLQSQ